MMAEGQERLVQTLIPGFNSRAALVLGVAEIITGLLVVVIGCVALAIMAFTSVGGSALLAGLPLIICGSIGLFSSQRKIIWAIFVYCFMSVASLVFCLVLVGAGVIGHGMEGGRYSPVAVHVREAVDILAVVVAIVGAILCVCSAMLTALSLFYGCCKLIPGVKYVAEPQVHFKAQLDDEAPSTYDSEPVDHVTIRAS